MTDGPHMHKFPPLVDPDQSAPAKLRRLLDAGLIPNDAQMNVAWDYSVAGEPRFTITIENLEEPTK